MLGRIFKYLKSLRIVSVKDVPEVEEPAFEVPEFKQDFFDLYKHPNFNTRVLDIVKLLDAPEFYTVTNPEKIEAARMLERADYQFYIFNYLDEEKCMYDYFYWTNMTSFHARDIADDVVAWKTAQEDITWEIRKILE